MDEQVQYDNLQFHEEVGEGTFGTVHRITFQRPFRGFVEAAAKIVRGMRKEEVEIMQKLNHPNIVTWLGFYSKAPVNLILMEYAQNGSLHDYLHDKSKHLPESLKKKWAKESALAIVYLHEHKCLHRDIKPNNCLLFENSTLKLCDFGLAREVDNSFTLSTAKGTYQYMAPEIIDTNDDNKGSFSIYTDIYAYGMLLLAIYTRQTPFQGKHYTFVVFNVGNGTSQPDIPKEVPEDIAEMMKQCWKVEPRKRPTMKLIASRLTINKKVPTRFLQAGRIGLHSNGTMVVAWNHKVGLLDANGKYKRPLLLSPVESKNGITSQIGFSGNIRGIAISPQGHVYIVENENHFIHVFRDDGEYLHSFSILTDGEDRSKPVRPVGATIDRDGNLLVVDSKRGVITILTCPGGEIIGHINFKVDHRRSIKVAVNSQRQILLHYSPDTSVNSRVVAIDDSGHEVFSFTPKIDEDIGRYVYPGGMVCDANDNIYIVLSSVRHGYSGHVHKYSPTGAFMKCITSGLYKPFDLSLTHDGKSIAVTDTLSVNFYSIDQI